MPWFPILLILHYTAFAIEISLIVAILYLNRKNIINRVAAILLSCYALWSLGKVFLDNPGTPQEVAEWVYRIYPIGWLFFASFTLLFTLLFTEKNGILKSKLFLAALFFFPVFFLLLFWSGNLQYPLEKSYFGWVVKWKQTIFTYLYYFYYIFFAIISVWLYLDTGMKSANPVKKRLSFIMALTMSASIICGTYMQILLPRTSDFAKMLSSATDVSVLFWILGLFYSIFKYNLLVLTPETTAEDIIKNMTEALIILDEYFNIIFFNKATLQLLECEENEIKNRSFLTLFTDFYSSNQWLRTNIAKHIYKSYETSLTKKGNKNVPVLLSSSLIIKQGTITGVVCIASDITPQKQAEQKMRENYEKLKELDRMKENFISMVSHELRTPLTAIKGFLSFLLVGIDGKPTPIQKEFLEIIQNNSDRLLTLINEILDISKMSSGGFSIQKSEFDIIQILDSSIRDMSSIIARKNIAIIKETPFSSLKIQIDGYRFSQAIINLLNNAIKFSPPASKITVRLEEYSEEKFSLPAEIKASMPENGKYVTLSIRDEGVGLTPEQEQKVFERFYQAEDVMTRKAPGTGLGLYITKNIVELHGGFIWVKSEGYEKGTTFYILLPME